MLKPFHLAIPVRDLEAARRFYIELLGCGQGRSSAAWVDLDLYGHQLVIHQRDDAVASEQRCRVDGDDVPVPHFGVVLDMEQWRALADRLTSAGVAFMIEPHIRFRGQPGEQATMFFRDPSGNALEFKAFEDPGRLFAS